MHCDGALLATQQAPTAGPFRRKAPCAPRSRACPPHRDCCSSRAALPSLSCRLVLVLQVVGLKHGYHTMSVMGTKGALVHAHRICQAIGVRILLAARHVRPDGSPSHAYLQLDGEPWMQDVPAAKDDDPILVRAGGLWWGWFRAGRRPHPGEPDCLARGDGGGGDPSLVRGWFLAGWGGHGPVLDKCGTARDGSTQTGKRLLLRRDGGRRTRGRGEA